MVLILINVIIMILILWGLWKYIGKPIWIKLSIKAKMGKKDAVEEKLEYFKAVDETYDNVKEINIKEVQKKQNQIDKILDI